MTSLFSKSSKPSSLKEEINKEESEKVSKEIKALRSMADKHKQSSIESRERQRYKINSISELKDEKISESESFQKLKVSLTGDAHFAQVTLDRNGKNLELWLPPLTHVEILEAVDFTRTLLMNKPTKETSMSKEEINDKENAIPTANSCLPPQAAGERGVWYKSFWKYLFASKPKTFRPQKRMDSMSWYHTSSTTPRMEQIVIDPGIIEFKDTQRMLMLTPLYLRVYKSFWISVLLRSDGDDYSTILIKADESSTFLKDHRFKIGFSFIKGLSGNLFALFVEFEGPYPFNCPTKPVVYFEDYLGLDFEENRDRLLKHLDTNRLHIWFAEGGSATIENDIMRAEPVVVKYEAIIDIDPACRAKLKELTMQHFNEHLKIGNHNWDFQKSMKEYTMDMPITKSPILPDTRAQNTIADTQSSSTVNKSYLDKYGECEAKYVVIFVDGDLKWTILPKTVQSYISKEAMTADIVLTTGTKYHVYRNSGDSIACVHKGESVGIIAIAELSLTLDTQKQMIDDYLQKKILVKEFYCPRSGPFFNRTPDCAVVIICA